MLNIHVVHAGGEGYYLRDLASAECGWEVRPAAWVGEGARRLGLAGAVKPDAFTVVMGGCHPASGNRLRQLHGASTVSGYDLTFCAPKSVSVLHALAPAEIADEVGRGHDAAVAGAVGYLARRALGVTRSAGPGRPVRRVPCTGAVASELVHRTSRSLDPHLHTHLVLANLAEGYDGRWSALDGRRVFAHAGAAQALYHAVLRSELTARMGVAWDVGPKGLGDVVGVDVGLRRLFSQRAAAIAEHLAIGGYMRSAPGPRAREVAALVTRPDKEPHASLPLLVEGWRARAADFGFDVTDLGKVVGRGLRPARSEIVDTRLLAERLAEVAPERPLERRDVERLVASASPAGASVEQVETAAHRLLASCTESAAPVDRAVEAGHAGPRQRAAPVDRAVEAGHAADRGALTAAQPREARWPATALLDALDRGGADLAVEQSGRTAVARSRADGVAERGREQEARDPGPHRSGSDMIRGPAAYDRRDRRDRPGWDLGH